MLHRSRCRPDLGYRLSSRSNLPVSAGVQPADPKARPHHAGVVCCAGRAGGLVQSLTNASQDKDEAMSEMPFSLMVSITAALAALLVVAFRVMAARRERDRAARLHAAASRASMRSRA